jgi:flavodoxin
MFKVVYYSRSGNTKKVAEAMAEELGMVAEDIRSAEAEEDNSVILLGTGCYGAVVPKDITDFIDRNRLQGRKMVLFTTSLLGLGKEGTLMQKQIQDKGVEIISSFNCYGQWLGMKRNHPDRDDLEKAREFARGVAVAEEIEHSIKQSLSVAVVAAV